MVAFPDEDKPGWLYMMVQFKSEWIENQNEKHIEDYIENHNENYNENKKEVNKYIKQIWRKSTETKKNLQKNA